MDYFANPRILAENVNNLTKYEDIMRAYDCLTVEEDKIDKELEELINSQNELETKMLKLDSILPNLKEVDSDSQHLSKMIHFTSSLAENVSSKVKQLDVAKNRVLHCLQRVEDVMDLKFCTDGVQAALQDEDYEKAAAHIHRFLTLDEDILRMSAHADEGSTLDQSFKLLHESHNKLKLIIHNKFDAAVRSGDVTSVERFFKMFPLIGDSQKGLLKFSKYLCSKLSDKIESQVRGVMEVNKSSNKRWPVIHADALSMLFEEVGLVVEAHQPLVESYYGHGLMILMLQQLQGECDRQMRLVVTKWKDTRNLNRKLSTIKESSLYPKNNTEKVDPKDLDLLLTELSLMCSKTNLYINFLRKRINNDFEVAFQSDDQLKEKQQETEAFLNNSELSLSMQEMVSTYVCLEEFYMRSMLLKAIDMDTIEDGVSSVVDDSFFVVKKCVKRALSASNVDAVCVMLNHSATLFENQFVSALQGKLQHCYGVSGYDSITQAYNLVHSTFTSSKLPSSASHSSLNSVHDSEAERTRVNFLTALNSTQVSGDYIQSLKESLQEDIDLVFAGTSEQNKAKLQSCLSDLGDISHKFKEMLQLAFKQLITNIITPRLKGAVDQFLTINHSITENEFNQFEANDPWVQNLIITIDNTLNSFKTSLTPGNHEQLVLQLSSQVAVMIEKVLLKCSFSRLGGMQLDKEMRNLVAYLVSVASWSVRDKFARLNQISTILNLDSVAEISSYWGSGSGSLTWRLTPSEIRLVLALRNDFRSDEIKKLKL